MENKTEKLTQFFEQVKTLTFWKRLFGWSQFKNLSYDAYTEFNLLLSKLNQFSQKISEAEKDLSILDHLKKQEFELSTKIDKLEQENNQLRKENTIFQQTERDRENEYGKKIATINAAIEKIQNDREKEMEEKHKKEIDELKRQKETWDRHERNVEENIRKICSEHIITYFGKNEVSFKGNPDNTIKVSDEFVVFDAKSPSSDDLSNFPSYIKAQTESVKKYIKEENVKKDIFLVIPSNTVNVIDQFSYNMAEYNVYVITLDSLEPIILMLKKLEIYQNVNELSPEDRENICSIIGKFTHIAKRKIQIDNFFTREFLGAIFKSESNLPSDILEKAIEYERSSKLNPPQEKRVKLISNKELEADSKKLKREAEAKEIIFPSSIEQSIKSLPLYNDKSELTGEYQKEKRKRKK